MRHDRKPIADRFPCLGDFQAVTWQAKALGTGAPRVPGPTDLRLAGVVRLAPGDAKRLRNAFPWRVGGGKPSVLSGVAPQVPSAAAWRVSESFTRSVTGGRYRADFFADFSRNLLVFDTVNPAPAPAPAPSPPLRCRTGDG